MCLAKCGTECLARTGPTDGNVGPKAVATEAATTATTTPTVPWYKTVYHVGICFFSIEKKEAAG